MIGSSISRNCRSRRAEAHDENAMRFKMKLLFTQRNRLWLREAFGQRQPARWLAILVIHGNTAVR